MNGREGLARQSLPGSFSWYLSRRGLAHTKLLVHVRRAGIDKLISTFISAACKHYLKMRL